jgi:hypothetical protein
MRMGRLVSGFFLLVLAAQFGTKSFGDDANDYQTCAQKK